MPGVREVFHARFVDHAYPPHTHDTWTVLLVDSGAVRYSLDRHDHGTIRSTVTVLPPHVVHDGRAATGDGFRKRVLYLEPDVLGEALIGRAVDRPTVAGAGLVRRVRALHGVLAPAHPGDALEAETRLSFVAEDLRNALRGRPAAAVDDGQEREQERARGALATALRDLLDARPFAPVTLAAAGTELGASPTHLVRCFTRAFGVPPHRYAVGRRIDAARRQLLDGRPPAEVAAAVGFHDQSHLARHFRHHVGTTPGRYARRGGPHGPDIAFPRPP